VSWLETRRGRTDMGYLGADQLPRVLQVKPRKFRNDSFRMKRNVAGHIVVHPAIAHFVVGSFEIIHELEFVENAIGCHSRGEVMECPIGSAMSQGNLVQD